MWYFCVVEKEAKSQSNFYKEWRKAINETKLTKLPPLKPISKNMTCMVPPVYL